MKFFHEGGHSKTICESCAKVQTTTFMYRDVPFSDAAGVVKDILVGVCDGCGEVVAVPAQSTAAIRSAREKATESIEAMLPAAYVEALDLACHAIDPKASQDLRKRVLLFYVHQFAVGELDIARLKNGRELFDKVPPRQASGIRKRLSFKISKAMSEEFERVITKTEMKKTDLLKSLVAEIKFDIVDQAKPSHMSTMRAMSAVASA